MAGPYWIRVGGIAKDGLVHIVDKHWDSDNLYMRCTVHWIDRWMLIEGDPVPTCLECIVDTSWMVT